MLSVNCWLHKVGDGPVVTGLQLRQDYSLVVTWRQTENYRRSLHKSPCA